MFCEWSTRFFGSLWLPICSSVQCPSRKIFYWWVNGDSSENGIMTIAQQKNTIFSVKYIRWKEAAARSTQWTLLRDDVYVSWLCSSPKWLQSRIWPIKGGIGIITLLAWSLREHGRIRLLMNVHASASYQVDPIPERYAGNRNEKGEPIRNFLPKPYQTVDEHRLYWLSDRERKAQLQS